MYRNTATLATARALDSAISNFRQALAKYDARAASASPFELALLAAHREERLSAHLDIDDIGD
jgi:hypothetical protein